jgi:hypothetical protein
VNSGMFSHIVAIFESADNIWAHGLSYFMKMLHNMTSTKTDINSKVNDCLPLTLRHKFN